MARWRVGDLLRGRRGSDWAIGAHAAGDRFLLLDPAMLLALDVPLARLGATVRASGIGPGDAGLAATDVIAISGRALRPPAPVALQAHRGSDGTIAIGWIRRSRAGWAWLDGVDVPLGEDAERYRLTAQGGGGQARVVDIAEPSFAYARADQLADGWSGIGTLTVSVVQIGTHAASDPPATAVFTV